MNPSRRTATTSPGAPAHDWLERIYSAYVRVDCEIASPSSFRGSIESHRLPGLDLSVVSCSSLSARRTQREISQDPTDCFIVLLQRGGSCVAEQDGRCATVGPGDLFICDTSRPYRVQFDDCLDSITLNVRGETLRSVVRDASEFTAVRLGGDCVPSRLLSQAMQSLAAEVAGLTPAAAPSVGHAMVNLVAASLHALSSHRPFETSGLHAYHVQRIKRFIDEHLDDPSLTVGSIAVQLGLSVAHLHRLFAGEPCTPSRYLWNKRLERCSSDLLDAALRRRSIADIAFARGFNDAAHFSRSFRERYGCSPRAWRRQEHGARMSSG